MSLASRRVLVQDAQAHGLLLASIQPQPDGHEPLVVALAIGNLAVEVELVAELADALADGDRSSVLRTGAAYIVDRPAIRDRCQPATEVADLVAALERLLVQRVPRRVVRGLEIGRVRMQVVDGELAAHRCEHLRLEGLVVLGDDPLELIASGATHRELCRGDDGHRQTEARSPPSLRMRWVSAIPSAGEDAPRHRARRRRARAAARASPPSTA